VTTPQSQGRSHPAAQDRNEHGQGRERRCRTVDRRSMFGYGTVTIRGTGGRHRAAAQHQRPGTFRTSPGRLDERRRKITPHRGPGRHHLRTIPVCERPARLAADRLPGEHGACMIAGPVARSARRRPPATNHEGRDGMRDPAAPRVDHRLGVARISYAPGDRRAGAGSA